MIIIDENIDQLLINALTESGYEIFVIRDQQPGMADREIIELVKSKQGLLLTEDKDFGEFVFSFDIRELSIVFIRYSKPERNHIIRNVLKTLEVYYERPEHFFITITKTKIRIRRI